MAETSTGNVIALLGPVIDAWLKRNERAAASSAGSLTFWRDGMLEQLQIIANGRATEETFSELKKNFDATKESTSFAMERLKSIRNKLGASKVADQIDAILNHDDFGKSTIRHHIEEIIRHGNDQRSRKSAELVCLAIRALNAEIQRLHRMVFP